MTPNRPQCVYCERDSDQVPLVALRYRDAETWICPQHLPVLIHRPDQLVGRLPGAEHLAPPEEHGHPH